MKTVTAKDFQLNQSQVMKDVAKGTVYQITYHGKPWVELHPGNHQLGPRAGSLEAFRASLAVELPSTQLPTSPDYKALRRQGIAKKYAE